MKVQISKHNCCLLIRFEPDMLAFSGCYYGGGEKERKELSEIRKRWDTLPVRLLKLDEFPIVYSPNTSLSSAYNYFSILFPFVSY